MLHVLPASATGICRQSLRLQSARGVWLCGALHRRRAFSQCFPRASSDTTEKEKPIKDPRYQSNGSGDRVIVDEYAHFREDYQTPKNPIILAHGLFGFDELHLAGPMVPGIHYWRGITEALAAKGIEVITATVSASGSIERRAEKLAETIERKAAGKSVNIIAHSMGGLDARHMISQLRHPGVKVLSLTTVATPHRGSAFADFMLNQIWPTQIPKVYKILEFFGLETGAFSQLTRKYMMENFNPQNPDLEYVNYYSYGASFTPRWWSMFWQSQKIVLKEEGPNDGLVSSASARWGQYQGTLEGVSHLDLINWTNRLRWWIWELTGNKRNFNAVAFYLDIAGGSSHLLASRYGI